MVHAGERYKQKIDAANQRHANGIESGQEQQAKRAP
jgi:hypothetical protein